MTKVIEFSNSQVKHSFIYVTVEMVKGLISACYKEHHNLRFGKPDLEGAFIPLYMNGLINVKHITENGKRKNLWYVTDLGKKALKTSGIESVY